jgi:porin
MIHGFVRYGITSTRVNVFDRALAMGLAWNGFIRKRPDDVFSLGVSPAWVSPYARLFDPALPTAEFQAELTYVAPINKWLTIQPDLIYIRFPQGNPLIFRTAFLAGVRFTFNLESG